MQKRSEIELHELLQSDSEVNYGDISSTNKIPFLSATSSVWPQFRQHVLRSGKHGYRTVSAPQNRRLPQGWQFGALLSCAFVGVVLFFNIGLTIYLVVAHPPSLDGIGEIKRGNCSKISSYSTTIHVLINICSSVVVAASNYNMQCLSAPTRTEVDNAHSRGKPLQIGVQSVGNLRFLRWWKICMWITLTFSTVPLHFLWNSAIFMVTGLNEYAGIVVTPDYLGAVSDNSTLDCDDAALTRYQQDHNDTESYVTCWLLRAAKNQELIYLNANDCINHYDSRMEKAAYNLIAVTRDKVSQQSETFTPQAASLPIVAYFEPYTYLQKVHSWCQGKCSSWSDPWRWDKGDWESRPLSWCDTPDWNNSATTSFACFQYAVNQTSPEDVPPSNSSLVSGAADWTCDPDYLYQHECSTSAASHNSSQWTILPERYEIDHCLMSDREQSCQLRYSLSILLAVIILNVVKFVVLLIFVFAKRTPILATTGDAVSSFLDKSDPITEGGCLMTAGNSNIDYYLAPQDSSSLSRGMPRMWRTTRVDIWGKGASRFTLVIGCLLWMIYMATGGIFLSEALATVGSKNILKEGFGAMKLNALVGASNLEGGSNASVLTTSLLVNLPQVMLSSLYFTYNALYTSMVATYDWSLFGSHRRTLRVSNPRGSQRSTYWLSLPWRFSIPLLSASTLMHWLLSQSIFLVVVRITARDNQPLIGPTEFFPSASPDGYVTSIGFSPLPIILSFIAACLMLIVLVYVGTLKLKPGMSVAGNNSLAISAACHRPAEDTDAATKPLMWGATKHENDSGPGHCCFTSFEVETPLDGHTYA